MKQGTLVTVYYAPDNVAYHNKTPTKEVMEGFRRDTQELLTAREDAGQYHFFVCLQSKPPITVDFPAIVAIKRDENGAVLEAKYLDEWDTEAKFVNYITFPKSK